MYAVVVFHGYVTPKGTRSLDANQALTFTSFDKAMSFAQQAGGKVKKLSQIA